MAIAPFSIDGLSSGLNTTEIIDSIIRFERRSTVLLEFDQAQKTNIISTLKALQAKFFGLSTALQSLSNPKTFERTNVTVSDDTFLSAIASGRAGNGAYDIQIQSIARNHQIASQGFENESISTMGIGTISIQIGDNASNDVIIDSSNNSLIGIKSAINSANLGVIASIINDGTSENAFRLVLSSKKTGVANDIKITSTLTGGSNLDYSSTSFDKPEAVNMNPSSTSKISLGTTASFSGSSNKIYTFTVKGSGSQIIGTDTITLDWTDGTNSGSIIVTQADNEVELVGTGSEGLKLSFAAGTLNEGDIFQVGTFAPLLQEATDARISVGSSGGSGSPIIITSENNEFKDVIGGLSITTKKETKAGESITINTSLDVSGIKAKVGEFIKNYNAINDFIDKQNSYNPDTKESGVLFGDVTMQFMQNGIRRTVGSVIPGIDTKFNQLFSIGIRTLGVGKLAIDKRTRFEDALNNNLDDVIKLFTTSGNSSSNFIEFISAGTETKTGEAFDINITQAASKGKYLSSGITDPGTTPLTLNSSNNRLKISVDGLFSNEMLLTEKTYNSSDELIKEIQAKIDNDDKIGNRGLTVKWVSTGTGTGYIEFESSTYGAASKIEMQTSIPSPAYNLLGITTGAPLNGKDVEGTMNGEDAEGLGQVLTAKEGNETTSELKLKITLESSQLGTGAEGSITISKGLADLLNDQIDNFTESTDGTFDRKISSTQKQIEEITERIKEKDEFLALRRDSLFKQFLEMESALAQLRVEGDFLSVQLASINANWNFNRNNR